MKTIKILIAITISVFSTQVSAQTLRYMYIHGKNAAGTADSIYYCGDITKIDSIDFHTTVPSYSFVDNFNAATISSKWTQVSGTNEIGNSALIASSNYLIVGTTATIGKVYYNSANALISPNKPFVLSVDMYITNNSDASTLPGIAFDISADNQKYQFIRNCGANTFQVLATDNDGADWPGVYVNGTIPTQGLNWYRYTVSSTADNSKIHIKITKVSDGSVAWESDVTTRPILGGKVGFVSSNGVGLFDNFSFVTE